MAPDPEALKFASEMDSLVTLAQWCAARGWVPATSGNFSVREAGTSRFFISRSGIDKGQMRIADLLEIHLDGRQLSGDGQPSAETGLHLVIYRGRPAAQAILHVHTVWNTILSGIFAQQGYVPIGGYELLKGLSGVNTHEYEEKVPILENSQDYAILAANLAAALHKFDQAHGVLLSRHGLYTWGKSVAEARRHLEALEFLFEVEGRRLTSGT